MLKDSDYLFHQLIPYIGNKRKLLGLISEAVRATGAGSGSFLDLFAGSGSVSRLAKSMGFRVISNDWEPYSYFINAAYIGTNSAPAFSHLGGIDSAFEKLNALKPKCGYITTHYCPQNDESPDYDRERMFYTRENGERIDAIREKIYEWQGEGLINKQETAVLLAPLVFQAAYCSNTSGVFKGFHRGWGGATKTAWYRIRSTLTVEPPIFLDNGQKNEVHREDAAKLAAKTSADLVYIDPPYNQHQYGSNYHLLNTVALWDKPSVPRYITRGTKSAIRLDWRSDRRSQYCYASTALPAFQRLIDAIDARFILASYSTDGIIPVDELLAILGSRGRLQVLTKPYKRYRVSSQRPSPRPHTVEFVAVVDTSAPADPEALINCENQINRQADGEPGELHSVSFK